MIEYKEDDLILCEVKAIEGTTVFIEINDNSQIIKGTISFSEISPGRIRNIREFVTIGKKIVCKVIRVHNDHLELSLRRVTSKEKDLVLESDKKEKVLVSILSPVLKTKLPSLIDKLTQNSLTKAEFFDKLKSEPSIIDQYVTKAESDLIKKAIGEKKEKEKQVKKIIILKSLSSSGLKDIKKILSLEKEKSIHISYLGSSKFLISLKHANVKQASSLLEEIIKSIQNKAKSLNVQFEAK